MALLELCVEDLRALKKFARTAFHALRFVMIYRLEVYSSLDFRSLCRGGCDVMVSEPRGGDLSTRPRSRANSSQHS